MKKYLAILPLALATITTYAEGESSPSKSTVFNFSTNVSREVDKDLMSAEVYSRKTGKNVDELKQAVSKDLNKVMEAAKSFPQIKLQANGVSHYANYDNKGKINGWVAEGRIQLVSKDFDAMAKVLDNLGDNVAIGYIDFSVSPEKMVALEDEMTLDAIKQFQHKAEVINKSLNGRGYQLTEIQLDTPNGENSRPVVYAAMAKMAMSDEAMPLEAGKQRISASATGSVIIEQ